jgi:DNA-3-methyladenine glycosylase II
MRRIRNRSDLDDGVDALLRIDPRLETIAETTGRLPLRLLSPDFSALAGIVVSQQVSRASAEAIRARLAALVTPLDAVTILAADEQIFRDAGLSRAKQRTLLAVARTVADGEIDLTALCGGAAESAIAKLTAISGIGPWTAEIFLMFGAGHCDIFPAGDLALQEAVRDALLLDTRPDAKTLRLIADRWSPWRSVAARLFWAYYRCIRSGRDGMPA